MIVHEAIRRGTDGSWGGAFLLMLGIETTFAGLFLLEAAVFAWLGTPDPTPDAVVGTEMVEFCISEEGGQCLSILRVEYGSKRDGFGYAAVLHPMRRPERARLISLAHGRPRQTVHSPVGDLAAIGCDDGSFYLLASGAKDPTARLLCRNPRGSVDQIAFSADGRLLLSLDDLAFKVWSVETGRLVSSLPAPPEPFCSFAVVPDSDEVLLGSTAGVVYRWGIQEPTGPKILGDGVGIVCCLACSPNGRRAVAVGLGGALHAWDLDSENRLWQTPRVNVASTAPAIFSADSKKVISSFAELRDDEDVSVTLIIRDAETGEARGKLVGHTDQVTNLAVSGDNLLHSGSRDGTVRTWDLCANEEVRCFSAKGIVGNGLLK